MSDDTFLLPIRGYAGFFMGLSTDLRQKAIDSTAKRLEKAVKEAQKLVEQVDRLGDNTPWRIAHEKRMRYYDAVDEILNARDTLRLLGVEVQFAQE